VTRRHRRSHAGSDEDTPIEEQVRQVIAVSFNLDEDDLVAPLSPETVAGWNSCSQMTLLLNLERRFGVSFSLEQMVRMTSAKRIAEVVRTMIAAGRNR
jgi:acyl carrier protein